MSDATGRPDFSIADLLQIAEGYVGHARKFWRDRTYAGTQRCHHNIEAVKEAIFRAQNALDVAKCKLEGLVDRGVLDPAEDPE